MSNNRQTPKRNQKKHSAHIATAATSFKQLLETPVSSLLNIVLIAIAISIPVVLKLSVDNFKQWAGYNNNGLEITLYLKDDIPEHAAISLKEQVSRWPGVESATYISKDAALDELKTISGLEQAIAQLNENPLPSSIVVRLPHSQDIQTLAQTIIDKATEQPTVASALFDMEWFSKAEAIINIGERIYSYATAFLSLGVLLVIGNTVRMTIDHHKEEILVSKLVGATDSYVRKPFIFMGMWVGSLGAIAGLAACSLGWWLLNRNLDALQAAYASNITLVALSPAYSLGLIVACALLGLMGAWLMCNKQLNKIAPE